MQTTITHKFPLGSTIHSGNARALVLGVSTDETSSASYLISIYCAYDGVWRRHWVLENELRDWIVEEKKDA